MRPIPPAYGLAASLRRVALLTSERTHGVQIQLSADTLALTSVGFDLGQAAEAGRRASARDRRREPSWRDTIAG